METRKMLKKPSLGRIHSDLYPVGHEQLFTELTPAEGALIEGGSVLELHALGAIQAGADCSNDIDEIYILVNGQDTGFYQEMRTGQTARIDKFVNFSGFAVIELFDRDGDNDDKIGSFTITGGALAGDTRYLSGSNSEYLLAYRVFQ